MDLFKKEDIKTYRLLSATWGGSGSFRELTFEYLLEWDPDALKERQCMNRTLLHKTASEYFYLRNSSHGRTETLPTRDWLPVSQR
jgi:hypothetical protein